MPASLSVLSFLLSAARLEEIAVAVRGLLVDSVVVLPPDLIEAEREGLCDLLCLVTGLPVQVAARPVGLRSGHVCLLCEPVEEDPDPVSGSIVVAVRAPAAGRRRLDATRLLRELRGAILQAIGTRSPGSVLSEIAVWAEHATDSPVTALRFAAAAQAAYLSAPHAPQSEIVAEAMSDVMGWLLRGVDPRVAEWVLVRALEARSPEKLVSPEAMILGETAALQRALAAGLVEHLPEEGDGELDLRPPFSLLQRLSDLPVPVSLPDLASRLKGKIAPQASAVVDRWCEARPRPLGLSGPLMRPDFTGRADVIERLVALFEPSNEIRTAVVYGMGGLGKSAFGAALGDRLSERLETVWLTFLNGPEAAWRRVADALRMPPGRMREEPRSGGVPAWLRHVHARVAERDALIVVDDVSAVPESELPVWLPKGQGSCAVLVLSPRAERVLQRENDAISLQLRPLDRDEAKHLLSSKVPMLAEAVARGEADVLLERLGGHPSAIGLVASLLQKMPLTRVTEISLEQGADVVRGVVRHAIESLDGEEREAVLALSVMAKVGSPRGLVARMLGEDEVRVGGVLQRLADRAIVELGPRVVKLQEAVRIAIETSLEKARWRELEAAHAHEVNGMMQAARREMNEELRDELVADVRLALRRMSDRCRAGDEAAADTAYDLASELADYPRGEPTDTLEVAIAGYEAVLSISTRESDPLLWGLTQGGLGWALMNLPTGDRTGNLCRAVSASESALSVYTREQFPDHWASLQNHVGVAYSRLPTGSRTENLLRSIAAHEAALSVFKKENSPAEWAMVQNNLGTVYGFLSGHDAVDENLRRSIHAFEAALTVFDKTKSALDWATARTNWATSMTNFPDGDPADNIRRAISAHEEALSVYSMEVWPQDWGRTQYNLGLAWSGLNDGERAANLHRALEAFRAALRVYTREAYPWDWARIQCSLAEVLMAFPAGVRRHNLQVAVDILRGALTVHTAEAFPEEHKTTQTVLDKALAALAALGPPTGPPPPPSPATS
jgi:tetratricopeptide (TPR) repeat protein